MNSERVYYHYMDREEFRDGMWRIVPAPERDGFVRAAAELMRDIGGFEGAMRRALDEWPLSCEQNLSTPGLNRRAWMGHAGCCLGVGSPEYLTRLGWHQLTQVEQDAANAAADVVLEEWDLRRRGGQFEIGGPGWPE